MGENDFHFGRDERTAAAISARRVLSAIRVSKRGVSARAVEILPDPSFFAWSADTQAVANFFAC